MPTPNQIQVTEEEIQKDDARFKELNTKQEADRTAEENTELGELKKNYAGRAEKRIGQLSGEKKAEKARADTAEERAAKAEEELQALKDKPADMPATVVGNENETMEVGGKKYYTDAALLAQIKANKITETAAIDYQAQRNEEKIVARVESNFQKKLETETTQKAQQEDRQAVLAIHPEFDEKHVDHNPTDPVYVEFKELVINGYGLNAGGLMKALKKAQKNLGIKNTSVDRSSDLGVEDTASPGDKGGTKTKEKEVPFSTDEEDAAVSMYTMGDVLNPATQRPYTRDEAIAKAKAAKGRRM